MSTISPGTCRERMKRVDNIKLRIVVWGLGVRGKRFFDRFAADFLKEGYNCFEKTE